MKFALVSVGSLGDVLPFCAIGKALARQGHDVWLLANAQFAPLAASHRLRFTATGTEADARRTESHPLLWHPIDGLGVLWRHLCVPALEPTIEQLSAMLDESRDQLTVLSSPLAIGARLLRDARPFTLLSCSLAPSNLRSIADPMFIGSRRIPTWMPGPLKRGIWKSVDAVKLNPLATANLNAWRDRLGLPPIREPIFGSWMHSPDERLALFPEWFGPRRLDWPTLQHCGFPFSEEPEGERADLDELEQFVACGPMPVAIYPGSSSRNAKTFLSTALAATRALGVRAILVTRFHEHLPALRPDEERRVDAVPFGWLLPKCRVIVHHGGVGTCAAALRAGIPQAVIPSAFDQFDNGFRIEWMGAGRMLKSSQAASPEKTLATMISIADRPISASRGENSWNGAERAATAAIHAAKKKGPSGYSGLRT